MDREEKFREIVNAFEEKLGIYWGIDNSGVVFIDGDSMRDELERAIEIMQEKADEFNKKVLFKQQKIKGAKNE